LQPSRGPCYFLLRNRHLLFLPLHTPHLPPSRALSTVYRSRWTFRRSPTCSPPLTIPTQMSGKPQNSTFARYERVARVIPRVIPRISDLSHVYRRLAKRACSRRSCRSSAATVWTCASILIRSADGEAHGISAVPLARHARSTSKTDSDGRISSTRPSLTSPISSSYCRPTARHSNRASSRSLSRAHHVPSKCSSPTRSEASSAATFPASGPACWTTPSGS
jgi:hypothetical protein